MRRSHIGAALLIALSVATIASAQFEVTAILRSIDAEARVAKVFAGGQERTVPISATVRVLDDKGADLPGGLKAAALKPGAELTLSVGPEAGRPTIQVIRLGRKPGLPAPGPGAPGGAPPAFDSSRLIPLTDLGAQQYQGFTGGLYAGGKNQRPADHETAGRKQASEVRALDASGQPAPTGKIVLLTLGMSNTSQATQGFRAAASQDPTVNPAVLIVNGAQGGMTAERMMDPADGASGTRYWQVVDTMLANAGVTREQVQAVWIKQADAAPREGFPGYARKLQSELKRIVQLLPGRFPHLKLAYLSSRTFAGWARTPLNPEPVAYESGFSVKWLVEEQTRGDASMNFAAGRGPVRSPWLSWGPYLWANGTKRRGDGFSYEEGDFSQDGTHESPSGQRKIGAALLQFFKTDSTTRGWFTRP